MILVDVIMSRESISVFSWYRTVSLGARGITKVPDYILYDKEGNNVAITCRLINLLILVYALVIEVLGNDRLMVYLWWRLNSNYCIYLDYEAIVLGWK